MRLISGYATLTFLPLPTIERDMRRLFRSQSLTPNSFKWYDFLALLNPREWDVLFMILSPVVGALVVVYIAVLWAIHFVSTKEWGLLLLTAVTSFIIVFAARLGFAWAGYFLAAIVGLVTAAIFSGYMDILLP